MFLAISFYGCDDDLGVYITTDVEPTDPLWLAYLRVNEWELVTQEWSNINAFGIRASGEHGLLFWWFFRINYQMQMQHRQSGLVL